jgi:hypothetical protein
MDIRRLTVPVLKIDKRKIIKSRVDLDMAELKIFSMNQLRKSTMIILNKRQTINFINHNNDTEIILKKEKNNKP